MISITILTSFESLLAQNLTFREAADSLSLSIKTIREAYLQHGRAWPTVGKLSTVELCRKIKEHLDKGMRQQEIGDSLKVSQPYISQLIRKFNLDSSDLSSYKKRINQSCEDAIEYIMKNGGSPANAIKVLKLNVHPQTIFSRAVVKGIDLHQFRYKSHRFGLWEILEGKPTAIYSSDYLVTALCHGCNSVHCVSLVNLKSGASTQCKQCASRGVKFRKVMNTETGKQYRSIRFFSKDIGQANKYQAIRKQLVKAGEICIDGTTFVLVE